MTKSLTILILSVFTLFGCVVNDTESDAISKPAKTVKKKLTQNLTGDQKNAVTESFTSAPRTIAILPFLNSTESSEAATILRTIIGSHLTALNMTVMQPQEVDNRLPSNYRLLPNTASYLGVEGVLSGEVVKFERYFAGVYSHIRLGVRLQLSDNQGQLIWETEQEVTSRAGGIATTPWGLLSNAAIASMHLDDESLFAAADKLSRAIALLIPQPDGYATTAPNIESVLHDSADQFLRYGDSIQVGLRGDPGGYASVEVGNFDVVDLKEVEAGVYLGSIDVSNNWNERNVSLTGRLRGGSGTVRKRISANGLVHFDNMPPNKVKNVVINASNQLLKGRWDKLVDADSYRILRVDANGSELLAETRDNNINVGFNLPLFEEVTLHVVALDKSGNLSEPYTESVIMYPKEIRHQQIQTGPLSGEYHGTVLLSTQFSPYLVNDNVRFTENSQIFVEPGVDLNFSKLASIEILGEAFFWGTTRPIRVSQSNEENPSSQYFILNSKKAVEMTGVYFNQGGQALVIKSGTPVLENVNFIDSQFSAMDISGDARVTVKYCLVDGSHTSGIVVSGYARLSMQQCEFKNNEPFHVQSSSVYPINIMDSEWFPAASSSTILGDVRYE